MIESKDLTAGLTREHLEEEVQKARQGSLIAARRGEYEKLAQLTLKLIRLSQLVPGSRFGTPEITTTARPDPEQMAT